MDEIRTTIYAILQSVSVSGLTIEVFQERPESINVFPSMGYKITSNVPVYDLDRVVERQQIEVTVDIWTNTSMQGDSIFNDLCAKMIANGFYNTFVSDIPEPSNDTEADGVSHINCRFNY